MPDILLYSLGELTRGMLVVDRREDESAYDPGANRAKVQAELEKHDFQSTGVLESTAIPAQVEVECAPAVGKHAGSVAVVVTTPGPDVLLRILTQRVWGL